MSVNYDLYETPDLAKSGEEQPLHARVVLKGSYTAEEFERIFGRAGRYRLFLPFIEC